MSRSPTTKPTADNHYNVSDVKIDTKFDLSIGKRSCSISTSDLTKAGLERVASALCGKKRRVDINPRCGNALVAGCKDKETKLHVVCGALFICGPRLLHVLGFSPVVVKVTYDGGEKHHVVKKMSHLSIKGARIHSILVSKLHIILDEEEYQAMANSKTFVGHRKRLTVPLQRVSLDMTEDKIGVLCHCGMKLSRAALETHLRPDFGPLSGAIKEKPIVEIEDVKFNSCVFSGGVFDRVAEAANEPNTWNLAFIPKISGLVEVRTNSRLVFGETITVEEGKPINVFLRGKFVLTRRMPVFGNCMVVSITLVCGDKQFVAQNIRLPLLASKSMLCLNREHFHGFVGVEGRFMKPYIKLDRRNCLFYSDDTLDDVAGKRQVVPYNYKKLFELQMRRLKRFIE